MIRFPNNNRGITLIELLVSAFLSAIVSAAALHFYLAEHKAWMAQSDVAEIQHSARACLEEIASTVRMAGFGLTAHPAYRAGQDSLTIYLVQNSKVDTIRYYVEVRDSTTYYLMRQTAGTVPEIYADGIESLTTTWISASMLELSVVARAHVRDEDIGDPDGYRRRTLTTRVLLRNTT